MAVLQDGLARATTTFGISSRTPALAGDASAAIESNNPYRALLPGDPNPWDSRGDVLYLSGRHDEAIRAYQQVLKLRPAFLDYIDYVKFAIVYADNKQFDLAGAALRDFAQRACSGDRLRLPIFEAYIEEDRGRLESAAEHYRRATISLLEAGAADTLSSALLGVAKIAIFQGDAGPALAFARKHKMSGKTSPVFCWLQAAAGDPAATEVCLQQSGAASPQTLESYRIHGQAVAAFLRQDPGAVMSAVARSYDREEHPWMLFYRGRAHLWRNKPGVAAELFVRAIRRERYLATIGKTGIGSDLSNSQSIPVDGLPFGLPG